MRPAASALRTGLWAAASGGTFLTPWSWLLTLPLAVTVLGGYDAAGTASERAAGVGVAFAVHALLAAAALPLALAERRLAHPGRRALVAGCAIVVLGILRPLLTAWLTATAGLPPFPAPMGPRIATNLAATTIALPIVAVAVTAVRRRAAAIAALADVAAALQAGRSGGQDLRTAAEAESRAVAERFRSALGVLLAAGRDADRATRAAALRAFAQGTARPLSHRLAAFRPPAAPGIPVDPRAPLDVRAAGGDRRRGGPTPPPPGLAVGLTILAFLPYALAHDGAVAALSGSAIALGLGLSGEIVTARLARAARARSGEVALLGATMTGAVLALVPPQFIGGPVELLPVLPSYLAVSLVAGAAAAAVGRLRRELARLEGEIARYSADVAEHGRAVHAGREAARRALHDDAQGGCLVAATLLERAAPTEAEARWAEAVAELERVARQLEASQSESESEPEPEPEPVPAARPSRPARSGLAEVLSAWSRAIELDIASDPVALARLEHEPALGALAVDVVSEALVNAVKHGARSAAIRFECEPSGNVMIRVAAPGRLARGSTDEPGTGLAALRIRAERLTLHEEDGSVVLAVRLGGAAAVGSAGSQYPNTAAAR
ncbi:hypothetical protein [Agromyces soli]|uniref:Signal transduction histidine kinase subgroup 3 dimerisation and phosphoacceptor domain-containing protein n=1 Tax=Agromyces soli TaxID=659012 RepID=A0ABY4AV02_9MICO|nr:hypothetical protein [Agromyces soli]UOE27010.1 hypothetical protein MTP13_04285 [Agromyces soli]